MGIALTIAGAALMAWTKQAQDAKAKADSLKSALESTGDASEQIIENLSNTKIDNSWLIPDGIEQAYYGYQKLGDLLDDVGIKMSDMALAAQGNAGAMWRINQVTDEMISKGGKQRDLANIIISYLDEESAAYTESSKDVQKKTQALDEVSAANGEAAASTDQNAQSVDGYATSAQDAADEIDNMVKSLFTIPGVALTADQASAQLADTIRQNTDSIVQNGAALDINTEKGNENMQALYGIASQAQATATKILEEGQANYQASGDANTLKAATDRANESLGTARDAFIRAAQAAGMNAQDAANLADKYGLARGKADEVTAGINNIPNNKSTTYTLYGADAAISKAATVLDLIYGIPEHKTSVMDLITRNSTVNDDSVGVRPLGYTGGAYTGNGFAMRGYASGGRVVEGLIPGKAPTAMQKDNVTLANARVRSGEFVSSDKSVQYYGADLYAATNRRQIPRETFYKAPQMSNFGNTYVTQYITNPVAMPETIKINNALDRQAAGISNEG